MRNFSNLYKYNRVNVDSQNSYTGGSPIKLVVQITLSIFILAGCSDEIADIEMSNEFSWQKFMNEEEFNELKEGMSYIDVVRVAGGEGKKVASNTYEWVDELLMTQAYELKFENDELVEKKIIEKRGHSTR